MSQEQVVAPDAPENALGPGRSGLPYRTAFETRLDYKGVKAVINRALRAWVKSKDYSVESFDAEVPRIGPGVMLHRVQNDHATGWQLREHTGKGVTWISTVIVTHDGRHPEDEWVTISVEGDAGSAVAVPAAKPPRLTRTVLDNLDAYDGDAVLRSQPVLTTLAQVEDLLLVVCATDRRLPVVVAAAPSDVAFDAWRNQIAVVMRNLAGLASMYVLEPNAAAAFNEGMGSASHRVLPGDIRTYLPDVHPAVDDDALRHRILTRRRIETDPRLASRLLETIPRRIAAASVPAAAATRLAMSQRDFFRAAARAEGLYATGPYPVVTPRRPEDGGQAAQIAQLREDLARAREELQGYEELLESAEEEIKRRVDETLDLANELELTQRDRMRQEARAREFQRRLVEMQSYGEAYDPVEDPKAPPTSFSDLLVLLEEHRPWVVFTGNEDEAVALDAHPPSANWTHTTWEAVLALRDYAEYKRAQGFDGDFQVWCQRTPPGRIALPSSKVAAGETKTVTANPKFSRQRMLPVPRTVDPTGRAFMGAHIKIARYGMVSPRLYFYDATQTDGTVYIGYIGEHLTNTQTS